MPKFENIYTTPASVGAAVRMLPLSLAKPPVVDKIAKNSLSRAKLVKTAFAPTEELHTVDLDYKMVNGEPVKGAPFRLTESTGAVRSGVLDDNGQAHIGGIQPGPVKVEYYPDETEKAVKAARGKLNSVLDGILAQERQQAADLQAKQDKMPALLNAFMHYRAYKKGGTQALKDTVVGLKELSDLINPVVTLSNAAKASWQTYKGDHTKPFANEFLKNFNKEQKDEYIDVLGFDPSKITREQIAQAYEITTNIMSDPESLRMLGKFGIDFVAAQDSIEYAEFGGAVVFEIALAAIVAALTGGLGLVGNAAKSVKSVKSLQKLGDVLIELDKTLNILKKKKKDSGSSNSEIKTEGEIPDEVDVDKSKKDANKKKLTDQEMVDLGKQRVQEYADTVDNNWNNMKPSANARKPNVVDVIVTKDGQIFEGYSTRKGHPNFDDPLANVDKGIKDAYDNVPEKDREIFHGQCSEVSALQKAKCAGADLKEAISISYDRREQAFKEACDSCLPALDELGVTDGVRIDEIFY